MREQGDGGGKAGVPGIQESVTGHLRSQQSKSVDSTRAPQVLPRVSEPTRGLSSEGYPLPRSPFLERTGLWLYRGTLLCWGVVACVQLCAWITR